MIKKLFKFLFKAFLGVILMIALLYGGFHFWEYVTGGKYIDYLSSNSETIALDESFNFNQLDQEIGKTEVLLVGEIHGFEEPQKFDYDLFTHLHAKHNFKSYYAELDYVQAIYVNKYLASGDETYLRKALKKWAVVQGRNNKSYFDKYRKFQTYFKGLNSEQKFKFIGVDKIQDLELAASFINDFGPDSLEGLEGTEGSEALIERIEQLEMMFIDSEDTSSTLAHLKRNLNYLIAKTNRESVLFNNFYELYKTQRPGNRKAYGYFGLYHVFQYQVNGNQPLASQLRMSDLGLENKILSINFLMVDSYMVMPSNQLPEFMRDQGAYTKMPISADVILFMYIYGIKDFKRMTPENHKSLIKMNGEDSPYDESSRMNKVIQILPVAETFEFNEKGKPYVQYTVFVRNSDWAEPE